MLLLICICCFFISPLSFRTITRHCEGESVLDNYVMTAFLQFSLIAFKSYLSEVQICSVLTQQYVYTCRLNTLQLYTVDMLSFVLCFCDNNKLSVTRTVSTQIPVPIVICRVSQMIEHRATDWNQGKTKQECVRTILCSYVCTDQLLPCLLITAHHASKGKKKIHGV